MKTPTKTKIIAGRVRRFCEIPDCTQKHYALGACRTHYARAYNSLAKSNSWDVRGAIENIKTQAEAGESQFISRSKKGAVYVRDLSIEEGSAPGTGGGVTLHWTTIPGGGGWQCGVNTMPPIYHGKIIIDPDLAWDSYNLTPDRALAHELSHFERFYDDLVPSSDNLGEALAVDRENAYAAREGMTPRDNPFWGLYFAESQKK